MLLALRGTDRCALYCISLVQLRYKSGPICQEFCAFVPHIFAEHGQDLIAMLKDDKIDKLALVRTRA